jgi:hypothetical protein
MKKPPAQKPTDKEALDRIAAMLDGTEWDSDTMSRVADIVMSTGRTVRDPSEMESDEE